MEKSSVEKIRARFDGDVERFSNLASGQTSTVDSPLALELMAAAIEDLHPQIGELLDIGCGAGNYALKVLQAHPGMAATLVDLSRPMLDRAQVRLSEAGAGRLTVIQDDIRNITLDPGRYDVAVTGSALHHLRSEAEWRSVIAKVYGSLAPGGSFWCFDLMAHEVPAVNRLLWFRYGEYLESVGGPEYRDKVFAYVAEEDTPFPLTRQLDMLKEAGFSHRDVLHVHSCFGLYMAVK
ncbi:class I SAM-dependent methyltransferase [Salinispira pacifica]